MSTLPGTTMKLQNIMKPVTMRRLLIMQNLRMGIVFTLTSTPNTQLKST
jgi:hypothetical protein